MRCAKCGATLRAKAGPGRPRRFCSPVCKRAADYELRRVQRALERIESRTRSYRVDGLTGLAERLDVERLRLEERLRELLDDGSTERGKELP